MIETSHGWRVWPSKASDMRISEMTDQHIKACINKLSAIYGRGYNFRQEWIKIFQTELNEREHERNRIKVTIPPDKHSLASITIGVSRMPKHCGECPFYEASAVFDEDAFFGDCIVRSCPFGGDSWGCLVQRPDNCPLCLTKG